MPSVKELLDIMARLRDPEGGCPWDLEQDFSSISPHTIEEAYEVDEAIASGDLAALRDELGDLLFQVVFQARIAEERGAFDFEGVVEAIVDKLIRRHPHVFGDAETPTSVEDQRIHWEGIKAAEREAAGQASGEATDPFAGIPRSLPALARSAKIAGRVDGTGVSVDDPSAPASEALETLAERSREVRDFVAAREAEWASRQAGTDSSAAELVGRGLRAWVQLARALGVDPEQALRQVDDEVITSFRANLGQASRTQVR